MNDDIDICVIIEELKVGKTQRTKVSLDKLNTLLEARFKAGKKDFSIATIGRVSQADGGVGTVSIRNKSGNHFRLLIEAWAAKAQTTIKKPSKSRSGDNLIPTDMQLLEQLEDAAMRTVFGQIIVERNKLRAENIILKKDTNIVIDIRPNQVNYANYYDDGKVEVISSLNNLLLDSEIEALKDAIDEEKINKKGWITTQHGAVKDENDRPIFKTGFILAIKKILSQI